MNKNRLIIILFVLLIFAKPNLISAQVPSGKAERSEKNFTILPIPYINYDRTLGFSGGFLPIAMYNLNKNDTVSPSSISGGFGMYTTNKSWFLMQFNKFYFDEDRYRAIIAYGMGDFNSQFFLDLPIFNDFIDFGTTVGFFKVELQRQIVEHLYVGLNYSFTKLDNEFDVPGEAGQTISQKTNLRGLGAIVSYDSRDNVYYPHKGFLTEMNYTSFPDFFENDFVSNKIVVTYNRFFEMKNRRDIIAMRLYTGLGIGELSFNQQFVVGNNDIRGYTQGKYRGEQTVALQGEYRWNMKEKFGLVGFAGVASVFSGINEADNGKLLPGIGAGFRYNVFPKNHLNVGMDFAAGIDDWGIYFKIGEAF